MSLTLYLLSILLAWATAIGDCLLIAHDMPVLALAVFLIYCFLTLGIAFLIEGDYFPAFRFIGSRDKPDSYEDWD